MKNISILLIIAIFSFTSCKDNAASKVNQANLVKAQKRDVKIDRDIPIMTFDKREFDFGTINENDIVETVFSFENTGRTALVITKATATCGCTIPEWPKEPIAPGAKGVIKVIFNSKGKKNRQKKTITLSTNTRDGQELLVIRAQVTPKS